MRITDAVPVLLAIVNLASSNAFAQSASSPEPGSEAVPIFEVSADDSGKVLTIDPIAVLKGKTLTPVPDACVESEDSLQFEKKYLHVRTRYSLVFGGRSAGTVTVNGLNGAEWQVNVDSGVKLNGLTMAIAVGGFQLPTGISKRREPTAAEVEIAKNFAAGVFQKHGVPASSIANLSISQMWAVDLHGGPQLFVAAEIARKDGDGIDYSLSFLADRTGGVRFIFWFQHAAGETEAQAVYLVDQLDINGDGADELFLRRVFYENYRYEVYRQKGTGWEQEFATQILGCE